MGLLGDYLPNWLPEDEQKRAAAKMGLLNFGAAMLANSNQGFVPALGGGLLAGAQGYQGAREDQFQSAFRQAQADALSAKTAQEKQQAAWMKQVMAEMSGSGLPSDSDLGHAALAQGAKNGSVGPTVQNAVLLDQMKQAAPRRPAGPSLQTLQTGALIGMKNIEPLFQMYKYQNDGAERKPGTWYEDPVTHEMRYIQDPSKGYNYDPATNSVSPIAGFSEHQAAIEGAKASAQEGARANFQLLPLGYVGQDGRPIGGTVGQYINGTPTPSPLPLPSQGRQQPATPPGFPKVSPDVQRGRDSEAYRIIKAEYDAETDPANKAALGRELFRLAGKGGRPVLQSEAEREAQVGEVRVQNAVKEKQLKDSNERISKDTRLYQQLTAAIPMARNLLKEATGSGAGALADQAMAFFGKSTKGAQAAQALDTIGGWMTANVPRMEGPQSNVDMLNYQTMAARVADRTQPAEARLAALDVLEQLQKKYAQANGITPADVTPNAPATKPASIPQGAIDMLRKNPSLRQQFEAKYGAGSAAPYVR